MCMWLDAELVKAVCLFDGHKIHRISKFRDKMYT